MPTTDLHTDTAWHVQPVADVARQLGTDPDRGLTRSEAARRLQEHGPNALTEVAGLSTLAIALDQFKSLIVGLLVAAVVVAFVLGENIQGAAILVAIGLNAVLGFLTEWKAQQALSALGAAVDRLAGSLPNVGTAADADSVRGYEGDAARVYFDVFKHLVRQNREAFTPNGRTRRPPLDRMNALLSWPTTPTSGRSPGCARRWRCRPPGTMPGPPAPTARPSAGDTSWHRPSRPSAPTYGSGTAARG